MINIHIVDDQQLLLSSLKRVIESLEPSMKVTGLSTNGKLALEAIDQAQKKPDVVLVDIKMPVMNGVETVKALQKQYPEILSIVLTTFDDTDYIVDALKNGAKGYILKDTDPAQLISSIKAIHDGSFSISPSIAQALVDQIQAEKSTPLNKFDKIDRLTSLSLREKDIAKLLIDGKTSKEIARLLFITDQTVRNHISVMYSKLDVHTKVDFINLILDS